MEPGRPAAPTLRPGVPSTQAPWAPTHPGAQRSGRGPSALRGGSRPRRPRPTAPVELPGTPCAGCAPRRQGPLTLGHSHRAPWEGPRRSVRAVGTQSAVFLCTDRDRAPPLGRVPGRHQQLRFGPRRPPRCSRGLSLQGAWAEVPPVQTGHPDRKVAGRRARTVATGPMTKHHGGNLCCSEATQDVVRRGRDPRTHPRSSELSRRAPLPLGWTPLGSGVVSSPPEPRESAPAPGRGPAQVGWRPHAVRSLLHEDGGGESLCNREHARRHLFPCMWSTGKPTFLLTKTMGLEINQPL